MIFAAIADWADSGDYPVTFMCDELGVSRSGYYAWRTAEPSQRSKDDATLIAIMRRCTRTAAATPACAACGPTWWRSGTGCRTSVSGAS